MILFRCSCGAAHGVDDKYAGGTAMCEKCGQHVPIPKESDSEVQLVYKAGESETGVPLSREEVDQALAAGELTPRDLIWHESTWYPLSKFLSGGESAGVDVGGEAPEIPFEAMLESAIGELMPVQGVLDRKKANAAAKAKSPKSPRKGVRRFLPRIRFPGGKKGKAAEARPARQKTKLYVAVQAVLGVLAVVIGFKFGFGPLISSVRKKTTYVVVRNHGKTAYRAKLGWRAVLGSDSFKVEIGPDDLRQFDIHVGMPETQTLTLEPMTEAEDAAEVHKIKLPLRPGAIVWVNVKGQGEYGAFDRASVKDKAVPTADLAKFADQVSRHQAPHAASRVANAILNIAKSALKEKLKDEVFTSLDYELPALAGRMPNAPATTEQGVEGEPEQQPRLFLACIPLHTCSLDFANGGHCQYNYRNARNVEARVRWPDSHKAVRLSKSRSIPLNPKAPPTLELRGPVHNLAVSMRVEQQEVKHGQKGTLYQGAWQYTATRRGGGGKKGSKQKITWSWSWRFDGLSQGAKQRLVIVVDSTGREKVTQPRPG